MEGLALQQSPLSLLLSLPLFLPATSLQPWLHRYPFNFGDLLLLPPEAAPSGPQTFVLMIELPFLLSPSLQISLGVFVSQPSAFHIFQITQKSVWAARSRFKEQSEISF